MRNVLPLSSIALKRYSISNDMMQSAKIIQLKGIKQKEADNVEVLKRMFSNKY